MKTSKLFLLMLIVLGCVFVYADSAQAGTTVIHVDTEEGGNVNDAAGTTTNTHGALFWTGTKWVSNDTAAHMYFTDLRTGERLQIYNVTTVQGSAPGQVVNQDGITATRSLYTYQAEDSSGGSFIYEAVQYDILQADGRHVILRSRGTGHGAGAAYFDIYVENPDGGGIVALRADPVWYNYTGMTMTEALAQISETDFKAGDLPSKDANYFLDVNGGSDMGGITFKFHTGTLNAADTLTPNLGSSFPISFSYEYMRESSNGLSDITFLPTLVSETHTVAVVGSAVDDSVTMASGGTTLLSGDSTWEIDVTTGTLKGAAGDSLTADDLTVTGLPADLTWTAKNNGSNKILINVSGTAVSAVTAKTKASLVIKGSAVTDTGATESQAIDVYIYPTLPIAGAPTDSSVTMANKSKDISAIDSTWEIGLAKGTLKGSTGDALTADDLTVTLPEGLAWTAKNNGSNKILITVTGTAGSEINFRTEVPVVVKSTAVTESSAVDSPAISVYLNPATYTVILSNEKGGLLRRANTLYGNKDWYEAINACYDNYKATSGGTEKDIETFLAMINAHPNSQCFTTKVSDFSANYDDHTYALAISSDGTVKHVAIPNHDGLTPFLFKNSIANIEVIKANTETSVLTSWEEGGTTFLVKGIAWLPVTIAGAAVDSSVTMASGNGSVSSSDSTWEIVLTTGTLDGSEGDALTADDLTVTGMPAGLTWTAKKGGNNNIILSVSGTASSVVTTTKTVTVVIEASAVSDTGSTASDPISVYVYPSRDTGSSGSSSTTPTEPVKPPTEPVVKAPMAEEPSDLSDHWAHDCIMALLNHGIIKGYPDKTIRPENEITRAEAAAVLVAALGLQDYQPQSTESPYQDEIPAWAKKSILIATEKHLMKGYPDGTFRPDQKITRAEMCVALMQAFPKTTPAGFALDFTDAADIPDWARIFIEEAVSGSVVSGYPDHTFQPGSNIKRAEAFSIICRLKGYHSEHKS